MALRGRETRPNLLLSLPSPFLFAILRHPNQCDVLRERMMHPSWMALKLLQPHYSRPRVGNAAHTSRACRGRSKIPGTEPWPSVVSTGSKKTRLCECDSLLACQDKRKGWKSVNNSFEMSNKSFNRGGESQRVKPIVLLSLERQAFRIQLHNLFFFWIARPKGASAFGRLISSDISTSRSYT